MATHHPSEALSPNNEEEAVLLSQCEQFKTIADNAHRKGNYDEAIDYYTQIISSLSPRQPLRVQALQDVFYIAYSNRCASRLQKKEHDLAITDARTCVALQPDWAKGHLRLAMCLERLQRLPEAVDAYEKVLELERENETAKRAIKRLRDKLPRSNNNNNNSNNSSKSNTNTFQIPKQHTAHNARTQHNTSAPHAPTHNTTVTETLLTQITSSLHSLWERTHTLWQTLSAETRQIAIYIMCALLAFFYFFSSSSSSSYSSYNNSYYYDSSSSPHTYSGPFSSTGRYRDTSFHRPRSSYYSHHSPYEYGHYSSNSGLSGWLLWAALLFAAYKLPPLFPQQLGEHARPFFGMSAASFVWLLQAVTMGGGGFFIPIGGGGNFFFGGRRRRYF